VLKNIATADLDQKKLVYLYLMSALSMRFSDETPCSL
jgi:vesicle coat complex subunit